MIDFPREPNPGENLDASWGARVVRALRALFPMPGPGIDVSTGPSGTTISSAPADEKKQTKPPELFECRRIDMAGTAHLACYCPSEVPDNSVWIGYSYTTVSLMTDRIAPHSPWLDLGEMPTTTSAVLLGFEDMGPNHSSPRWAWRLYVLAAPYIFPSATIKHFPAFPLATIDGGTGSIVQLRTGAIWVPETWFFTWYNDLNIGLRLHGTNGSVLAVFNDTDGGGISAEFKGDVSVVGDVTIGGKLNGEKPVWKNITIDGTSYKILCNAASRP